MLTNEERPGCYAASMSHKLRAHLMLTAVVCVWGATFVVIKSALADISPLLFNLIRMTIASACLLAIYGRRLRRLRWATLGAGALTGLCLAAGYQFQTAGLRLTTPSKSAFLTGLVVVLVPLLAGIPGLRPPGASLPKWNAWLGVVAAFVGIVLLTAPQGSGWSILMLREINPGDLLTLACALGFSLHVIALAHFSPRFDFEQLAILQIVFCTLAMGVTTPLLEKCWVHWTPRVVIALVVAAVLATAAAFTVQAWAQQILPATHTALILALEPVFAWVTAFLVLRTGLHGREIVGALLILAGIGVTELMPSRMQPTMPEMPSI
ncbi:MULTISPECIES: DMT family transporter [Acidobacterium]|nr:MULTISPECIES: DMT family transporter [Acidobacterium]